MYCLKYLIRLEASRLHSLLVPWEDQMVIAAMIKLDGEKGVQFVAKASTQRLQACSCLQCLAEAPLELTLIIAASPEKCDKSKRH